MDEHFTANRRATADNKRARDDAAEQERTTAHALRHCLKGLAEGDEDVPPDCHVCGESLGPAKYCHFRESWVYVSSVQSRDGPVHGACAEYA